MSYRVFFIPKKGGAIRVAASGTAQQCFIELISILNNIHLNESFINNFEASCQKFKAKFDAEIKARIICAPDEGLKEKQRIMADRLQAIPVSQYAHGFVRNRDPYSCALAHTEYWGEKSKSLIILNADAKDFFHSISSSLVSSSLRAHGFTGAQIQEVMSTCMVRPNRNLASGIIKALSNLFINRVSQSVVDGAISIFDNHCNEPQLASLIDKAAFLLCSIILRTGKSIGFRSRFLPQGAPTSPVISNIVLKIADIRIAALAGKYEAFYTRYADDFTFSWHKSKGGRVSKKAINLVYWATGKILNDYGIEFNPKKRRVMSNNVRQDIVGYCVNSGRPTISGKKRKLIRAIAHNELVGGSRNYHEGKRCAKVDEIYGNTRNNQRDMRNLGLVSQLYSAHFNEARKYLNQLMTAMERPFINCGHGEEIEVYM